MSTNYKPIRIGLADDHILLREGLAMGINEFPNFKVTLQADNGNQLIEAVQKGNCPDVLLLDMQMPGMNGLQAAKWLSQHSPGIRILVLSMFSTQLFMINWLKYGIRGFLQKQMQPEELHAAILTVMQNKFYYSEKVNSAFIKKIQNDAETGQPLKLMDFSEQEIGFIKLCATELAYKEMGAQLNLTPRVCETLRVNLFNKMGVETRVGLVFTAFEHGILTFS